MTHQPDSKLPTHRVKIPAQKHLAPNWLREAIRVILKAFVFVFYRLEVTGLERIPESGKVLLCPNHVSAMDIIFIGIRMKRLVRWMAKAELWNYLFLGGIIESLGAFPVRRGKGDVGAIRTSMDLIEQGELVGIFAEGHRVKKTPDKGYRIHSGAAMLAIKTATPVVPVGIEGNARIFSKVRIVFGEPYYLDGSCEVDYTHAEYVAFSKEIMRKAYGLVGQTLHEEGGAS